MTVQIDGTLVAPFGYTGSASSGGEWIVFDHVDGLTVSGGTLDGRGESLWACKAAGHGGCPDGATVRTYYSAQCTDELNCRET
jgi:polygalacturonase